MALVNCPECGKEISDTADKCPHCGKDEPNALSGWALILTVIFIIIVFIFGMEWLSLF
jgi:predicted amidophosphoribosyltransferase